MGCLDWKIYLWVFIGFASKIAAPTSWAFTDPRDVFAINSLYAAMGLPPLPGWVPMGGDPCAENWQGVLCVNANITGIVLNGANLGGELGENLGAFASIIQIDLSNNHIGGSIPSDLPITIRSLFLSANQFTGDIPVSLSTLGQLSDLSFNNNKLTGVIPDAFQQLTGLINLDLSGNDLTGQLPPSMMNLSSLATLYLQNNQLSGSLDVLQDLPLMDLNVENNLFWGPIPDKLFNIPNFRRVGNPFNTTVIPSPPTLAPASSPSPALPISPSPDITPGRRANEPSPHEIPHSAGGEKFLTTKRITWISIAGFSVLIIVAFGLCLFMSKCCKPRPQLGASNKARESSKHKESFSKPYSHVVKVPKDAVLEQSFEHGKGHGKSNAKAKPWAEQDNEFKRISEVKRNKEHEINMTGMDANFPPPPLPLLSADKIARDPIVPPLTTSSFVKNINTIRSFTIASLQEYTNSFSQDNLLGGGILGTVYRAELPNGRLLAVKKLDAMAVQKQSDEEFLKMVSSISKLKHANIVELVAYCAEHGQRLLVHEYCINGTLHEALHLDDEIHKRLTWNARIHIALGAARALEYMHEVCQPPHVHQNFKSANVLLDDELAVHISDCGLAPLISSSLISQLQSHGSCAPELELGNYGLPTDVHSFGVVMLELLTGRKSFDRSRPRGEQSLVRWAVPRLHDIDALSKMVDPSLNGIYSSKSLSRFADIISLCVQPEPEFRPPMSEIVQNLVQMVQRDH